MIAALCDTGPPRMHKMHDMRSCVCVLGGPTGSGPGSVQVSAGALTQ